MVSWRYVGIKRDRIFMLLWLRVVTAVVNILSSCHWWRFQYIVPVSCTRCVQRVRLCLMSGAWWTFSLSSPTFASQRCVFVHRPSRAPYSLLLDVGCSFCVAVTPASRLCSFVPLIEYLSVYPSFCRWLSYTCTQVCLQLKALGM